MPTIVSTVGGTTSNSFVSVTEADLYCDTHLNADAWNTEDDDDQKARALIEATRELSAKNWIGMRVTTTQALSWPRAWAQNPDAPWPMGYNYYDQGVIPDRVKNATCELALQFLKGGTVDIVALDPNVQVIEKVVGPLTTRYAEPYQRAQGLAKYPTVMRFITPLLMGSSNSADVIRG